MILSEKEKTIASAAPYNLSELMSDINQKLKKIEGIGLDGIDLGKNLEIELFCAEGEESEEKKKFISEIVIDIAKKIIGLIEMSRGKAPELNNIEFITFDQKKPLVTDWETPIDRPHAIGEWAVIVPFGDLNVEYCRDLHLDSAVFNGNDWYFPEEDSSIDEETSLLAENKTHKINSGWMLFVRNTDTVYYRFAGGKEPWHVFIFDIDKKL